jgi:hypothetical protein
MKRLPKLLLAAGSLPVLLAAAAAVKFYLLSPAKRPAPEVKAPATAEAVARGRYLAHHVAGCLACHSETLEATPGDPVKPGRLGSGKDFGRLEGFPGIVRAPNLTSHLDGLATWTDGEILRAIREGVSRDGRPLFPFMPYKAYAKHLTDADALAIVAYLRTLPPLEGTPPRTEIDFPVSMFARAAPKPVEVAAAPLEADPAVRGRRLLELASCTDCHDAFDARHRPVPGQFLAGGMAFAVPGRGRVHAPNLTPDPATGLGAYTDEELMNVFRRGVNRKGRALYVMPWSAYAGMTDEDLRAVITALRALPPVSRQAPPPSFHD